jgi:SHS family lactate transporter-like MFS transporter
MTDLSRARRVVVAAYLGWALDAFDFVIMGFVFSDIAAMFGVSITVVTVAVTLTLAMRAIGAVVLTWAERQRLGTVCERGWGMVLLRKPC